MTVHSYRGKGVFIVRIVRQELSLHNPAKGMDCAITLFLQLERVVQGSSDRMRFVSERIAVD